MKKNKVFFGVLSFLMMVALGGTAVLTSMRLQQKKFVAPTAPESKPMALSGDCSLVREVATGQKCDVCGTLTCSANNDGSEVYVPSGCGGGGWCMVKVYNCPPGTGCGGGGGDGDGGGGGGGCFLPDTQVLTPEGEKAIAELKEGDQVVSFDLDNQKSVISKVEDVHQLNREGYYLIRLESGKKLEVTAEHPLYTRKLEDRISQMPGWVEVLKLKKGDLLKTKEGWEKIQQIDYQPEPVIVYNLTTQPHAFFANGILAHNAKSTPEMWVRVWGIDEGKYWGHDCGIWGSGCGRESCWHSSVRIDATGCSGSAFLWVPAGFYPETKKDCFWQYPEGSCNSGSNPANSSINDWMKGIEHVGDVERYAGMIGIIPYQTEVTVTLTPPPDYICKKATVRWHDNKEKIVNCSCSIPVPGSGEGQMVVFEITKDKRVCAPLCTAMSVSPGTTVTRGSQITFNFTASDPGGVKEVQAYWKRESADACVGGNWHRIIESNAADFTVVWNTGNGDADDPPSVGSYRVAAVVFSNANYLCSGNPNVTNGFACNNPTQPACTDCNQMVTLVDCPVCSKWVNMVPEKRADGKYNIKLIWETVANADGYYIYRCVGAGCTPPMNLIAAWGPGPYLDKNLTSNNEEIGFSPGQIVRYEVRSHDSLSCPANNCTDYEVKVPTAPTPTPTKTPTPTPTSTPIPTPVGVMKVFVSSTTHDGNFGGLRGADQICQNLAQAAGLTGTYKAWLSDASTNAKDRIPNVKYVLKDGTTVVADDRGDLLDGSLDNPIVQDEYGQVHGGIDWLVWTGTKTDGTKSGNNCQNWSATAGQQGSHGINDSHISWTAGGSSTCTYRWSLYCFQTSTSSPGNLTFIISKPEGMVNLPLTLDLKVKIIKKVQPVTGPRAWEETVRADKISSGRYRGKINNLEPGAYDFIVKPPRHLSGKFTGVNIVGGENSKGWTSKVFWAGDVSGSAPAGQVGLPNDKIDIYDINLMVFDFDKVGLPAELLSDTDYDGKITIYDLNFTIFNFDKKGEGYLENN